MSYHETFWVVVGTAAPVIALAAVVALPDTSPLNRTVTETVTGTVEMRTQFPALRWSAIGNVLVQAGLLALSLTALAYHGDVVPPWVAIVLEVGGILLLAVTVSAISWYRKWAMEFQPTLIEEQRLPGYGEDDSADKPPERPT